LDPILAQGAGVALEDSYHVSEFIAHYLFHYYPEVPSMNALKALQQHRSVNKTITILLALSSRYFRMERIQRLQSISNLAQWIGHINSPLLNCLRDSLLTSALVPNTWKGKIFDYMLSQVAKSKKIMKVLLEKDG
jgi:2-polyprenyl-6-methoxyphenol hydroxylase-like FAD-dependent oxidoreductase